MAAVDTDLTERVKLDQLEFYAAGTDAVLEVFAQLRREAPVFWCESGQFWVLTKYEDIRHVWSNPGLFTSEAGHDVGDNGDLDGMADQLPDWCRERLLVDGLSRREKRQIIAIGKFSLGHPEVENFLNIDPPRHDAVRKIFTRAVNPRFVRDLRGQITEIVDEVLDAIEPGSRHDFVQKVSGMVPTTLIAALLGVPDDVRPKFMGWADAFVRGVSLTPDSDPELVAQTARDTTEFLNYCDELVRERRAQPEDDLTSVFVQSELDGKQLTHGMALMYTSQTIVGGSDTTRHNMSFLGKTLAEHPDQRRRILDRPELLPNAIEESLRYNPIVWSNCRTATQRMEIRGQTIEKDDYVCLVPPSGNRDEDIWERPDAFDVGRSFDESHLAFGWGEHACAGVTLVRLATTVLLERLLDRFPNWELAGEPHIHSSLFLHGVEELPVRFLD